MITTPSASIPTKSKPMPVSSLRVVVRCTSSMPATMTTAATAAPRYGEKSKTTAAAMPGSTPWTNASPKKLIPRRTSQTPTTDAITPAIRPPRSARCWKPSAKGSRNHSTGGSAQCVGDGRGVLAGCRGQLVPDDPGRGGHSRHVHPEVRVEGSLAGRAALIAERQWVHQRRDLQHRGAVRLSAGDGGLQTLLKSEAVHDHEAGSRHVRHLCRRRRERVRVVPCAHERLGRTLSLIHISEPT